VVEDIDWRWWRAKYGVRLEGLYRLGEGAKADERK
jgi:hypothetical protein